MSLGILSLHIGVPGCGSLKEKRSRIKPLLARLHREFNVSVAELEFQDRWQETLIGCALLSSDTAQTQRALQSIADWVETNWLDLELIEDHIEIIP